MLACFVVNEKQFKALLNVKLYITKLARRPNCPNDWSKYKRTKCYVTNLVRKSKRSLTKSQKSTQFNIPLIIVQETQKFIDNLSSSKATGADEISVKVLKLVSPVFVQALTRLINSEWLFSNQMKNGARHTSL